jgi:hypothetical protein
MPTAVEHSTICRVRKPVMGYGWAHRRRRRTRHPSGLRASCCGQCEAASCSASCHHIRLTVMQTGPPKRPSLSDLAPICPQLLPSRSPARSAAVTTTPRFPFDAAYLGDGGAFGLGAQAPWSIGEPQPALAALIEQGKFHGDVRDIGCGEGAISNHAAVHGCKCMGLDFAPTTIDLARVAAAHRGAGRHLLSAGVRQSGMPKAR